MTYQPEAKLEDSLIELLSNSGYEKVTIANEDDLKNNFRKQINKFNTEKLNGKDLSDGEFRVLMNRLEGKSVIESATIIRDKLEIERDDGSALYLELISSNWTKNIYQITNQITIRGSYENRYDVTLLVNGLPMVQIELKRRGLDMKEAFNQICRYKDHSFTGLFSYLQLFVVSNGMDTRYFSNANKRDGLNYEFTFFWTDEKNNRITNLESFAKTFLDRCHLAKMITKYMVVKKKDGILMVLRPYQVHAVEQIVDRALNTNNNGYIWHSTGSGKTLTSFKASEILSKTPSIDKVFFLVDRVDLDDQTLKEFNEFSPGSIDDTDNTGVLVEQIEDINRHIIVTTIHKMANAIRNPRYAKIMDKYKEKKVIFVIDECHRSQFGLMHRDIRQHFANSQYFGFTGTPIFDENIGADKRTTADLFDKCLHHYLMKDAIFDENVLGFLVTYISTIKCDLIIQDENVEDIDRNEVYKSSEHYNLVVDHIIEFHNQRTNNRAYNSIFATDSIDSLMNYYDLFKEKNHDLTIGAIFSFAPNMDLENQLEHDRDKLERVIQDYNKTFDTNFSTDTFKSYRSNLDKKFRERKIDILIVVDMFLTGYDSKLLNTLYVDKNLKYHGLLQAYSRTNRVYNKTKPFGNIVCFRNLKERTDEALRLFSKTDKIDDLVAKPYEDILSIFLQQVMELKSIAPSPEVIDSMDSEKEQRKFIEVFRELTKNLVKMENYKEFEFNQDTLNISEQEYQDYRSKYFLVKERHDKEKSVEKVSILDDIDFALEIMQRDRVNVDYIMNLIKNIDMEDKQKQKQDVEYIFKELDRADNRELRSKVKLIRDFLDEILPKLDKTSDLEGEFDEFETQRKEYRIIEFAEENNLDKTMLSKLIQEYEFTGSINLQCIKNILVEAKYGLLERRRKTDEVMEFVLSVTAEHS